MPDAGRALLSYLTLHIVETPAAYNALQQLSYAAVVFLLAPFSIATGIAMSPAKKVSPGCKHCYAEVFAERFRGVPGHPYEQGFDVRLVPEKLTEPFLWPRPRMVFVNSMSDLFQDDVPDDYILGVTTVMQ